MRIVALTAIVILIGAGAGATLAEEPVVTAPTQPAPPASATPPAPLDPDGPDQDADGPRVVAGPCGPRTVGPDGKPDTKAHGQLDVAVGTGDYHRVRASICKPLGQNGAIAASIEQGEEHYGRRR